MMTILNNSLASRSIKAALCAGVIALLAPSSIRAQLFTFSKQDLMDYTAQEPFDRLPDGRPKVPNDLVERARELASEEVWAVLQQKGFNNQNADGFKILPPAKTMAGRAFTFQCMPLRPAVEDIPDPHSECKGWP